MIYLIVLAIAVVLLSGLRVAQEYERGVVFRLGRYKGLRGPGLYWIMPLGIERAVTIDIRTRTVSAEQSGVDHARQRDHEGQRGAVVSHRRMPRSP